MSSHGCLEWPCPICQEAYRKVLESQNYFTPCRRCVLHENDEVWLVWINFYDCGNLIHSKTKGIFSSLEKANEVVENLEYSGGDDFSWSAGVTAYQLNVASH